MRRGALPPPPEGDGLRAFVFLKFEVTPCAWAGMTRPAGPVKIKRTDLVTPEVMTAELGGAVSGQATVLKHGSKYFFIAPDKGTSGAVEVPADSLIDCLHASVWRMGAEIRGIAVPENGRPPKKKKKVPCGSQKH